jgi:type II secretory pathway pseudopilin PulG
VIPPVVLAAIGAFAAAIVKLLESGGDRAKQEEALMEGAESAKRALDWLKFGDTDPPPPA